MKKQILSMILIFTNLSYSMEFKKDSVKILKNKKCGFELNYPQSWIAASTDEPDVITGLDLPIEEAGSIGFYVKDEARLRKFNDDSKLSLICFGDGTDKTYEEDIKWVNEYKKYEKSTLAPKTKVVETIINNNKAEIVVRESNDQSYGAYTYIYCESNKRFFDFSASRKYNVMYNKFSDLEKKSIILENIFNSEQLFIINSFKCPDADFTYKKPEKPKIKKK